MRIVALSDTHGNSYALESVILRNTDADWIFHLGDGERELDNFILSHQKLAPKIIHVAGNCDFDSLSHEYFVLPVLDHKILATHGHLYGVSSSLDKLRELALANECDIVLFGHTHMKYESYENGIYFLNPGSASIPRDGSKPSFGHIDISPAGVVLNIADV
ncbi:metallophosphoesterase [Ruminococcus sp.]|uniref:metallophosphoesterase n=1 Tax=Ruminococcus sp. TaxID=41978 RepID=UPI0025DC307D|nr:metallophosphoesterase [Ruminococcus sp.]